MGRSKIVTGQTFCAGGIRKHRRRKYRQQRRVRYSAQTAGGRGRADETFQTEYLFLGGGGFIRQQ